MQVKRWLFPSRSRYLPGQRWLNVFFRTLHLVGLGGLGAGFLYSGLDQSWQLYMKLTLISGLGLSLISVYSNGIWLLQLRGLCVFIKLLLLLLALMLPPYKMPLFLLVVVISGWIAHAPARVRYYSLFHRRQIESLD